jgi:DNA (cytosine-5)-methyltransferase 1
VRKRSRQLPLFRAPGGLVVDLFAGGGGASTGIEAALGRPVDIAINHDKVALAVHCANHPQTAHLASDIWEADPAKVVRGRRVSLLWASPDCTDHSNAKGGKPRRQEIRSLAWVVTRWTKAVRPDVVVVENVPEFRGWCPLGPDGRRDKTRLGETFRRWIARLESHGYAVEYRVLDASEFGAPTRRRRLFLVARCDGLPIVWPERTHGPSLLPLRTAAECIDWSLPCPSIFERADLGLAPLVDKTLWRIAQGIRRFVFDAARPFVIKVNHGRWEPRHESIDEPLSTVTASRRGHGLVIPTLQQSGFGERPGQSARVPGLNRPLGTIVAKGQKHALVAAFLARHFGDPLRSDGGGGAVVGADLGAPLPTVTARDHHSLAAVTLAHFRGTDESQPGACAVDAPMPTVSAGGIHVAEVRAFLAAYYGNDGTGGQTLTDPMRTLTARHRLGLVTVEGAEFQIVDIGFRMLQPHELLRAQFGRFAATYDLSAATTKKDQVRLIGNSVCPEVAEAIVRANAPQDAARAA